MSLMPHNLCSYDISNLKIIAFHVSTMTKPWAHTHAHIHARTSKLDINMLKNAYTQPHIYLHKLLFSTRYKRGNY